MSKHLSNQHTVGNPPSQDAENEPINKVSEKAKHPQCRQTLKTREFLATSNRLPDDYSFRLDFQSWEQPDIG